MVGFNTLIRYYHGTNSPIADIIADEELTPHTLSRLYNLITRFDWTDYTDFGKGFYVHLEENKTMAYEWARRRFSSDWAVVEFIVSPDEFSNLPPRLDFQNKTDRPANSPHPVIVTTTTRSVELCALPQFLPIVPCIRVIEERATRSVSPTTKSWLEFVEYNRHIDRRQPLIARPNDRDWTGTYSSIRGPIWVPRDSGYNTGLPIFPDHIHQLNLGLAGMKLLNRSDVKIRRFKFSAQNEGLFPPPA